MRPRACNTASWRSSAGLEDRTAARLHTRSGNAPACNVGVSAGEPHDLSVRAATVRALLQACKIKLSFPVMPPPSKRRTCWCSPCPPFTPLDQRDERAARQPSPPFTATFHKRGTRFVGEQLGLAPTLGASLRVLLHLDAVLCTHSWCNALRLLALPRHGRHWSEVLRQRSESDLSVPCALLDRCKSVQMTKQQSQSASGPFSDHFRSARLCSGHPAPLLGTSSNPIRDIQQPC
eukprot:356438-Chlamydomonas_euryale.AAC.2